MGIKGIEVNSVQNNVSATTSYPDNVNATNPNQIVKVSNETQVDDKKENNKAPNEGYTKKDVEKAVKKLNKFLEDDATHAEYSVHKDLGTIMIKVIDDKTQKVLLEVPSKKVLDMIASMCKSFGIIDKKA